MSISTLEKVSACNSIGLSVWGFHSEADVRAAARGAFLRAHPDKTSTPTDNGRIAAIRRARGVLVESLREDARARPEPMDVDG